MHDERSIADKAYQWLLIHGPSTSEQIQNGLGMFKSVRPRLHELERKGFLRKGNKVKNSRGTGLLFVWEAVIKVESSPETQSKYTCEIINIPISSVPPGCEDIADRLPRLTKRQRSWLRFTLDQYKD